MIVRIRKARDQYYWNDKVPIKFSIDTLNIILAFIISNNTNINRGNLINIRKLFKMIDLRIYEDDFQHIARVKFIKRALKARLDDYIDNPNLVLEASRSKKYEDADDMIIEDVKEVKLTSNEIKYVNKLISDKLTYSFLYKYKDSIIKLFERLENGEYENFAELSSKIKKEIGLLTSDIRRAENLQNSDTMFSLTEEFFESVISKTVKKLQSPENTLKTGMQALNEMFNGGLQATRLYLLLGLTGGFKSGTLLNLAYQIKMNNKNYKTKEPGKLPTILFVTHENTVEETIDRLFSLCCAKDVDDRLKNYSPKDAIKLLKNTGFLKITKENNIDLLIIYKASNTIDTGDLDSMIDELEEAGREIICLIHDYIKKIKPVNYSKETKDSLANAIDELKAIAIARKIPVITASQLNREASKSIDAEMECNKTDLARFLGSSNVGESWKMIENADVVLIVNRERQLTENRMYLTFKRLKIRYGTNDSIDYFNQPFMDNEFGLIQDVGAKRLARKYLADGLIGIEEDSVISFEKRGRTNSKDRKIIDNPPMTLTDLSTVFKSAA